MSQPTYSSVALTLPVGGTPGRVRADVAPHSIAIRITGDTSDTITLAIHPRMSLDDARTLADQITHLLAPETPPTP